MKDISVLEDRLKKIEQQKRLVEKKLIRSSKRYEDLQDEEILLTKKRSKENLHLLADLIDNFKIDLSEDFQLYSILGFLYSTKVGILNKEQLAYFELLGKKYLDKKVK